MFYEVLGNEPVSPALRAGAQRVLDENEKNQNLIVTSVITHLEVLPQKLENKLFGAEQQYLSLFDAKHFVEIEISTNIILRAREIRDFYYVPPDEKGRGSKMMDSGDAIHLATATIHQVRTFHTRDNCRKRGNLPLLDLYKATATTKICGRYELEISSPEKDQGGLDV